MCAYKTRDKIKREIQMMVRNCEQMERHLYKIDMLYEEKGIDNSKTSAMMYNLIQEVKVAVGKYREVTIG